MFWIIVLLLLGLILIIKGGDWFVSAASRIAEISGIPHFIIGATIVSLGTTLPELLTSAIAAAKGQADMAVGNAVGSVNANIALIMAISLVCMPHDIERKDYAFKSLTMVASVAILYLLCLNGSLNVWLSLILLVVFAAFLAENIVTGKKQQLRPAEPSASTDTSTAQANPTLKKTVLLNVVTFLIGAACIVVGADLLVDNGSALATRIGIPESVIAVTIVAIGTSLPELVTTITAIAKKKHELSIGNIIGANIIDITLILPICSVITGGNLPLGPQSVSLDLPFCLIVSSVAVIPTLIFKRFARWQGIVLFALYAGYFVLLF